MTSIQVFGQDIQIRHNYYNILCSMFNLSKYFNPLYIVVLQYDVDRLLNKVGFYILINY
jgi:hypothetical protein